MLPDYPEIKSKIHKALLERMDRIIKSAQLGDPNRQRVFEGDISIIHRADGTTEEIPYKLFESGVEFNLKEMASMTPEDIIQRMDLVASDMAKQSAKHVLQTIEDAIEKAGNTMPRELTAEILLDVLEKLPIDFLPNGTPIMPELYIHPNKAEATQKILDMLDSIPELAKRKEEIITRKKEEWRVRESDRKLVG